MNRLFSFFDRAWPALVLTLLIAITYWPGRNGGFVFDDYPNIVDNVKLHVANLKPQDWVSAIMSSDSGSLKRPIAMLSFAANHALSGLDPMPMKLTNIAIHAFNAWLVLALVRLLIFMASPGGDARRHEWTARFAAIAWALHPINLMAVLFIVQRMESLSHTFVFGGLCLYLLGRKRQLEGASGWGLVLGGLLGGTVLGAMSKESAVLLPLYALLAESLLPKLRFAAERKWLGVLFAATVVAPAFLGLAWILPSSIDPSAYAARSFTLGERLLTESRVVWDYLHWSVLPSLRELSLYHDDYQISRGLLQPPATLAAIIGLLVLFTAAVALRKRRTLMTLGFLWFLSAQLLTATVIPLELVYEHRNYFASLGVCLVLADLLLLAPRTPLLQRVGVLLACLALLVFASTTYLRANEWSDPYRFAKTEAIKHPRSPRATYAIAQVLTVMSEYRKDSPILLEARTALEHARQIPGSGILPSSGLLILAARAGMPLEEAWWADILYKLQNRPIGPQEIGALSAMTRCARDHICLFPRERMLSLYAVAMKKTRHPDVATMYGDYAFNVLGNSDLALQLWGEAISMRPLEMQYRVNIIKLLITLKRYDEARREISALREIGRFGQNESAADALAVRLSLAEKSSPSAIDRD